TEEAELPELYSSALACVYPSYYEGFGLPVLEAMQCGALVIASRDPAISEIAGDGAILLDVNDKRAWVEALRGALEDRELYRTMRAKGPARAPQFSWTRTGKLPREVYEQAAERFRKKT